MKKEDLPKIPEMDSKQWKKSCPPDVTPEQAEAIDLAEEYGLGAEIEYCIFELGMSSREALEEWDLVLEPVP